MDTTQPFAFFVHTCEPQPEAPKPVIQPNDRLPQLVAEMVQKGLNASPKVPLSNSLLNSRQMITVQTPEVQHLDQQRNLLMPQICTTKDMTSDTMKSVQPTQMIDAKFLHSDQLLHTQMQLSSIDDHTIQVGQILPMQNMEGLKLQMQPQIQQLTQVVVATPQLDMTEPLLMCQPTLMFDPTQVIPVTTLPHHFVQVHSHNIASQQGHFL